VSGETRFGFGADQITLFDGAGMRIPGDEDH